MKRIITLLFLTSFLTQLCAQVVHSDFVGSINLQANPPFANGLNFESSDGSTTYGRLSGNEFGTSLFAFNSSLKFFTGSGVLGGPLQRMILNEDGFLGINTPTPSEYLDVRDGSNNSITLNGLQIEWKNSGTVNASITNVLGNTVVSNNTAPLTGGTAPKFELMNITSSGLKTQLRVDYSGDIGIGDDIGPVPAAVFLKHKENPATSEAIGAAIHGVKMQNSGVNNRYFSFYVADSDGNLYLYSNNSNNAIATINASSGSYFALSDKRHKKNIQPLGIVLPNINKLTPSSYKFKNQAEDSERSIGIMAQELAKYFPEVVTYNAQADIYHVDYGSLAAVAIKAIQEQEHQILNQQEQLMRQQEQIDRLERIASELIDR